MCGIFAVITDNIKNSPLKNSNIINKAFELGKNRGPESSKILNIENNILPLNITLGFHRLAINGLDNISMQPFNIFGKKLICNGEIYNYKELYKIVDTQPTTNSDCEVILHLYNKFGIETTLQLLDGVFSFILVDEGKIYAARDRFGVRPLYYGLISVPDHNNGWFNRSLVFASEMKQISKYFSLILKEYNLCLTYYSIDRFLPSHYVELQGREDELNNIEHAQNHLDFKQYYKLPFNTTFINYEHNVSLYNLHNALMHSVKKRVETSDREVCCLLSGGLDSSLIAALVAKYKMQKGQQIETYSIGIPGSEDLKYAKIVANWIGSKHTEVLVTAEEMFDAIPEVIHAIESFDTTTVRASVGNYLVSKYISQNSNAKVVFNGDGADEVMGGYLYFHLIKDPIIFDQECRRLVSEIYHYDVLRSDKSISSNGLEPRTPYLDEKFVRTYFDLPAKMRCHPLKNNQEKYLIRELINLYLPDLLPSEVLYRTKEAFSDGVSGTSKSWYEEIQDRVHKMDIDIEENNNNDTVEAIYYKKIFSSFFPREYESINYKQRLETRWMPRFIDACDPSARTLSIYSKIKKVETKKDLNLKDIPSALDSYLNFNLSN